jgi:hypothetical protein
MTRITGIEAAQEIWPRSAKTGVQDIPSRRQVAFNRRNRMTRWVQSLSAPLLAAGLALGAAAQAAGPQVSVPSTPDSAGRITIKGTAVQPLSNVTVRFAHTQAAPIDVVAQATSIGSFAVNFQAPITGGYGVTVYDSNGQLIGKGRFGWIR